MKFYVGAPLSQWESARKTISALRSMGHECTHDWTLGAEAFFKHGVAESNRDIAKNCIDAVKACDFAFFLPSISVPMQGMWAELGAALALEKPAVVYLPDIDCAPELQGTVYAWLSHAGAFLFHPGVDVQAFYHDCFRGLQIIENKIKEKCK